jgi:hypothetical protein
MAETWFLKSKDLYLKQELLYDKLEVIGVTESEIESIEYEIDRIDDEIILEIGDYHNLFFIDEYQDTLLSSKEECLDWIGNTENVRFRNFVFEGKELNEDQNKKICLNRLDKFWESYPDGLVLFV